MSPTLWWISIGIIFLLIEFAGASLYGITIAIACWIAAIVCWLMGGEYAHVQLFLCLILSAAGSLMVPKVFRTPKNTLLTGIDAYIGTETEIHIVDGKAKVSLDGVERLVTSNRLMIA
jgi:membrane protein implicated in regulation of membrane protease activity